MPLPRSAELFYGLELTDEQRNYVDSIFDNQMTIVDAASGTGKTTIAVGAASLIGKPTYYIFSPVEESRLGYLPGRVQDKESVYVQPLVDAVVAINEVPDKVIYDPDNINQMKEQTAWLYPMSHVFARGTNLKDCTVIIDEAQNFTRGELKKVLTRIHDNVKVVMIGHHLQCDLEDETKSGFRPYLEHFRDEDYASVHQLTVNFRGRLSQHADNLKW